MDLRAISVIPDDLDAIARTVRDFHERFDLVFTSGGVGPTHDDVTIEGIARGFERRVIRQPELEQKLRDFYKEKVNEARLKMSEVPEGAELIYGGTLAFPTMKIEQRLHPARHSRDPAVQVPGDPRALRGRSVLLAYRVHTGRRRRDRAVPERHA